MKTPLLLTLCSLVVLVSAPALTRGEDFLLYTPKPAAEGDVPASPDKGVLVKSATVERGDTLKKLSRKHIGVASWFPQVLVFNTIKNPDLIHPGDKLLVPVTPGRAEGAKKQAKHKIKKGHAVRQARHLANVEAAPPVAADEQDIFQRAKRAYLNGEYQRSLDLFDSFLRKFPKSKLAADASLYRADCYLRLSGH